MIQATQALQRWLLANNIEPNKVRLTLSADPMTADKIGFAIRHMSDDLSFVPRGSPGPIREGTLFGIPFRVTNT